MGIYTIMKQLLGEYNCKIDTKGRMRMPSNLIAQLEVENPKFVINRGFENCLVLYPEKVWEEITIEINALNPYDKEVREFKRYFYRGATPLNLDSADRLNLPNSLVEWAGIDGEAVLSAVDDRIEMWSKAAYEALLQEEPKNFADLAQSVLGNKKKEGE